MRSLRFSPPRSRARRAVCNCAEGPVAQIPRARAGVPISRRPAADGDGDPLSQSRQATGPLAHRGPVWAGPRHGDRARAGRSAGLSIHGLSRPSVVLFKAPCQHSKSMPDARAGSFSPDERGGSPCCATGDLTRLHSGRPPGGHFPGHVQVLVRHEISDHWYATAISEVELRETLTVPCFGLPHDISEESSGWCRTRWMRNAGDSSSAGARLPTR